MTEPAVVGKSVVRKDALEKVTGKARFTDDFKIPGMLQVMFLASPHTHAKIKRIDTSKAKKLPGVRSIVTGQEAPEALMGRMILDQPPIARDMCRFAGEPVAVVAADNAEIAEKALELIDVQYEPLPAVFDVEEAMKPNCPVVIHPDLPNYVRGRIGGQVAKPDPKSPNVFHSCRISKGNIEKGFQKADLIVENKYRVPRLAHCPIETARAHAWTESDGMLNIRSKKQGVYTWRTGTLNYLGLSGANLRNLEPYVGGSFGGTTGIPDCIAGLMAMKTGRPVRFVYTREQQFVVACPRVDVTVYIKDGVKKDGTLIAREMKVILDGGAYSTLTSLIVKVASFGAVGTYRIANFKWDSYGVYTNNPPAGAFRGFGDAEVHWAIEQQMDIIAEKLGIDPVAIRKKNVLKEGDEDVIGETIHSIGVEGCLDEVAKIIELDKPAKKSKGPWKKGKGVAISNKVTQTAFTDCITIKVHQENVVEVRHSATEMGQGVLTVIAQMVAESFGIPVDDVRLVFGDTAVVPFTTTTGSSSSTWYQGHAALRACENAKQQIFSLAAPKLGVNPQNLEIKNWIVYDREVPHNSIKVRDLFGGPGWWVPALGEIIGRGEYTNPSVQQDEDGQSPKATAYFSYGANGAEVAVNVETGEVKVEKFASIFDMGKLVNPQMGEGQMQGGMAQGIGSVLYEEVMLDQGRVLNPSLVDYRIPSTLDLPAIDNVKVGASPVPHKNGPFGAKGFGEGVFVPTAPAVANAIYNATGVRVKDLPVTREKLWLALQNKKKGCVVK